jgi:hypothetical protein
MPGAGTSTLQSNQNVAQNTAQQQNQTSVTNPYRPAWGNINTLLGLSGQQANNVSVNPAEAAAFSGLAQNLGALPNLGGQVSNVAQQFMQTGDPSGLLKAGNQQAQDIWSPIANESRDPTKDPGMQNLLQTIQQDVGNQVNSQFAGAGRNLSGLNQQALARGISQGEAVPLLNQYNQNTQDIMNAGSNMFGANYQTGQGINSGYNTGANLAGLAPQVAAAIPYLQLQAAMQQQQLPFQNISALSGMTSQLASLGGSQSGNTQGTGSMVGTGQTNTTVTPSLLSAIGQIGSGLFGGAGILGGLGLGAPLGTGLLSLGNSALKGLAA